MDASPDATVFEPRRPDWSRPTLAEARDKAQEFSHLNAFISFTEEENEGPVVAVKDLIDVRGVATTGGGIILGNDPALDDAPVVQRVREAGCVVLGKTNLHEWAFGATSVNPHYGTVYNPRDSARVAGGSSGGSAVAAALGMCAFAIGSDSGGSIRIPASLSGVVGIKPTIGSVSLEGVIPLAESLDTVGPLAPDVASAALALEIISGSTVVPREPLPSFSQLKIAVPEGWVANLDDETAHSWNAVSQDLPRVDFPDRKRLFEPALTILAYEAARFHEEWLEKYPDRYGKDVLGHLRQGQAVSQNDYQESLGQCESLRGEVEDALNGWDAVLVPATAWVAPRPEAKNVREPLTGFTRPFNTTGHPVLVLPVPTTGLPVGVQIVGHFGKDASLVGVGLACEQAWRGRDPW